MTHPRALALALSLLVLLSIALPQAARADAARIVVQRDAGAPQVVTVPAAGEDHALAALNADPGVRFAAPDVPVRAATNDTIWPYQWGLEDPGSTSPYRDQGAVQDADIDAESAWSVAEAAEPVTVAVADTRIDTRQPDLAGRFSDIPAGPDVSQQGCSATTPPDHGTAVAGIVGAQSGNGVGIAGVAPNAKILPVPALNDCGGGTLATVLAAFDYAAANGAQIVVASFATDPRLPADEKARVRDAFDQFFADPAHAGTLFVVAAGNEGNDNDASPVYPCSSGADNLICVGASTIDDSPSCQSNVGHDSVDLFAPGYRIWTTVWSNGTVAKTAPLNGTSMAAPMVAGVAAMLAGTGSADPDDASRPPALPTATDLGATLRSESAVDVRDAMTPISVSHGRLNAAKALGAASDDGLAANQWAPWQSCDADHDGVADASDHCAATDAPVPVTSRGCADVDGDGVPDADPVTGVTDNCQNAANTSQADTDGDGVGDACDTTPRGADADGDGLGAVDDACPSQYAVTANGCPPPPVVTPPVVTPPATPPATPSATPPATPIPTPGPVTAAALRVTSLHVKLLGSRCKAHRACRRDARLTVKLSGTANVALVVEKRVRSHHRWVWRRVTKHTLYGSTAGSNLTVKRLGRAAYRVSTVLGGAPTVRRAFTV